MAVTVLLQSVLPSHIIFCYISDNYTQRKHMHITIDTNSRTLSGNNKLRDYTESGFVFIVLFQLKFRIPTYTVIHSLFCGVKLHVKCSSEYFDEEELVSMEVEDLFGSCNKNDT